MTIAGNSDAVPVTEAERTPEAARERFRNTTRAALATFQNSIFQSQQAPDAIFRLNESLVESVLEYRHNIRAHTDQS